MVIVEVTRYQVFKVMYAENHEVIQQFCFYALYHSFSISIAKSRDTKIKGHHTHLLTGMYIAKLREIHAKLLIQIKGHGGIRLTPVG